MIDLLEYFRQFFEAYSNIEFNENPLSGSRVVPCGQLDGRKDRHDEANRRFSQFCERDQKGEIVSEFFHPIYVVAKYTYKYVCICVCTHTRARARTHTHTHTHTHTQTFLFRRLYNEYSRLFTCLQIS